MNEKLLRLINDFKRDGRLISFSEEATKQVVVLRILNTLGWNPFNIDEVYPEYSVGDKRVDYSLRYKGKNKVFIEVKKIGEDLVKHQEQLLNYSFQEGVRLAILTNGISWWFYLPLHEGSWEQRKFYTIEIYDQESNDIVEKFEKFLSKENVISDKAIENAEKIYKNKQKHYLIKETLPKAWKKLITEPDDLLVELLADTTERLCGYKPNSEIVGQFLAEIIQGKVEIKREVSKRASSSSGKTSSSSYIITGKTVISFTFRGNTYPVRSWKEMLLKICEIVLLTHRNQFEKVLNLAGRKRPYFTKNPYELRSPEKINGINIYVETNLNASSIVKLSKNIITLFGYTERDLSIEVQ